MAHTLKVLGLGVLLAVSLQLLVVSLSGADTGVEAREPAISSRILETDRGERVLIQEVVVDAPVAAAWKAHVTDAGYAAWAAPVAKVDLKIGRSIRSHYGKDAKIGDPGTVHLHIVNYVPERVLTLRAETADNWPEVMKQDAEHLMNVIVFQAEGKKRTRILSYGCGYRDRPEYEDMLKFFVSGNEGLYKKPKAYLEKG